MSSKIIWLFIFIVLIAIVSSILKIKEEFKSRGGGRTSSKGTVSKARSGGKTAKKTGKVTKNAKVKKTKKIGKTSAKNINTMSNVLLASAIMNSANRRDKNKKNRKAKGGSILKLTNNNVVVPNDASIEFGAGMGSKEENAGKIRYGGWDAGALNIVGAGGNGEYRNVRLWDKLQVGPLEIKEDGCIGYGPGKKFTFCFQPDGNIVQYKDKKPIWATGIP